MCDGLKKKEKKVQTRWVLGFQKSIRDCFVGEEN